MWLSIIFFFPSLSWALYMYGEYRNSTGMPFGRGFYRFYRIISFIAWVDIIIVVYAVITRGES